MSTDRTTEILNYLSAISREVGELRSEMHASVNELRESGARVEKSLAVVQADVKEIKLEMRVFR